MNRTEIKMNKPIILDDVLPKKTYEELSKLMIGEEEPNFPWWWHHGSTSSPDIIDDNVRDNLMLCHQFYIQGVEPSPFFGLVGQVIPEVEKKLEKKTIDLFRVKGNLTLPSTLPSDTYNVPHKDQEEGWISILYYVNDADGDTIFFDDDALDYNTVSPKANRAAIFDSNIYHCTMNNQTVDRRMVINYVLRWW